MDTTESSVEKYKIKKIITYSSKSSLCAMCCYYKFYYLLAVVRTLYSVQWTGDSKHSSNFPRVCDAKKLSICQCPGSDNAYFIMGYNGPKFVQITAFDLLTSIE